MHPDLIPTEKLLFIPEPPEPYMECGLFLKPHELIHSKQDGLWYLVHVRIVEFQDWSLSSDSSDDSPDWFGSSNDEEYPSSRHGGRDHPWLRTSRFNHDGASGSGGGSSLGSGWGPSFLSASKGLSSRAWSLATPMCFEQCTITVVEEDRCGDAVERGLAPESQRGPSLDAVAMLVGPNREVNNLAWWGCLHDPMIEEAGRLARRRICHPLQR